MPINTLYHSCRTWKTVRVAGGGGRLFDDGDYFNYQFSGVPCVEESNASTTQMYDPRKRAWSEPLIRGADFPSGFFRAS